MRTNNKSIKQTGRLELKGTILAIIGIVLSKLCCILPLLGLAAGGSSFMSGLHTLSPFLLALSVLILAFSWYRFVRADKCACHSKKKKVTLLLSTGLVIILISINLFTGNDSTGEEANRTQHSQGSVKSSCH